MQIYDSAGRRKYLTPNERRDFLTASESTSQSVRTLCGTLAHTGCRISEALALTGDRVDLSDGVLIFESLKKRRRGIYRAVPVPPEFLETLTAAHGLAAEKGGVRALPLWPWSRSTAWRHVRAVMRAAGIEGRHASPKGLRHGFGIKAVLSSVPLNMTQKWLGHARIATTCIYAESIGPEVRHLAERMWR